MRQRYVVQVIPEEAREDKPVEPAVVTTSPASTTASVYSTTPAPSAPTTSSSDTQAVDPEQAERIRYERVQQMLRQEVLKKEPVEISKPPTPKRVQQEFTSPSQEDMFTRRLSQSNQTQKIERLYQSSAAGGVEPPSESRRKIKWPFPGINFPKISGTNKIAVIIAIFILTIVSVLFGSVMYVRADIASTEIEVRSLILDMQESRITSANERLESLQGKHQRYLFLYQNIRPVFRLAQGRDRANHIDHLFEISGSGLRVLQTTLDSYEVLDRGYKQFLGLEQGKSTQTFSEVAGRLEILYTELSSLQASTARLRNPYQLDEVDVLKVTINDKIPQLRKYFLSAQQLSFVLPDILGEDGQRRQYLVLLQNNAELRPTGGFIGSFALLTIENGQLVDFRVEDVYEADGQLLGYVEPPEEIVRYLGEPSWFLRDSNWSPDFPTVANQAAWFLDKQIKIQPDGVIGINLEVVRKLLDITGPIELIDYNEIITKDNLYDRAQQHAELNFFPGSSQKRDFLSAVSTALYERFSREESTKIRILQALIQSAEESELLVSIFNDQANVALGNLGWDGALRTPDCPHPFTSQVCLVDTVMQVEANVGVNKANQHIQRSINHSVILNSHQAQHKRTILIENTGTSNAWPEGAYKSYLRLFVSQGAQLSAVSINGSPINLETVSVKTEKEKVSFGFLINVPVQSSYEIKMEYVTPIPVNQPMTYALFEQKQPGAGHDPLSTSITVQDREVVTVAPEPVISGQTMNFSSTRRTHQMFAVETR